MNYCNVIHGMTFSSMHILLFFQICLGRWLQTQKSHASSNSSSSSTNWEWILIKISQPCKWHRTGRMVSICIWRQSMCQNHRKVLQSLTKCKHYWVNLKSWCLMNCQRAYRQSEWGSQDITHTVHKDSWQGFVPYLTQSVLSITIGGLDRCRSVDLFSKQWR